MTLEDPEMPPYPRLLNQVGWTAWSYGRDIDTPQIRNTFGDQLCDVIIRCLAHQPSQRPTLRWLRNVTTAGVTANPLGPVEQQWARDILFGPSQVPPAVPMPTIPATKGYGARLSDNDLGF